jgi:SAM-dependent methyltransferase
MVIHVNYDEAYYTLKESEYGFAGQADKIKFQPYIKADDQVLDFGCGGGAILSNIVCGKKLGIDANPRSRKAAEAVGIPVVANIEDVEDGWADVIISHHALEHIEAPFSVVQALRPKLKPNGKIIFVVPCEGHSQAWDPKDMNNHLYTWSPLNLGNLFRLAGYQVVEARAYYHRWPPKYHMIQKFVGWPAFHTISKIYGRLFTRLSQTMVIATPNPKTA